MSELFEFPGPPPDGKNPLEDLAWVKKALAYVVQQQAQLIDIEGAKLYSVRDLAKMQDLSEGAVRNSPWRIPNFGNPDVDGPARWWGRTVKAWFTEPEGDRRRRWEAMGSAERRRAMGRSA